MFRINRLNQVLYGDLSISCSLIGCHIGSITPPVALWLAVSYKWGFLELTYQAIHTVYVEMLWTEESAPRSLFALYLFHHHFCPRRQNYHLISTSASTMSPPSAPSLELSPSSLHPFYSFSPSYCFLSLLHHRHHYFHDHLHEHMIFQPLMTYLLWYSWDPSRLKHLASHNEHLKELEPILLELFGTTWGTLFVSG